MNMQEQIAARLTEIETTEHVKILLAVESGSRAWGFASPDSDYDVRFIYLRRLDDYLHLEPVRDVLEYPISDLLDFSGWDLQKTLKLLGKSNQVVMEWLNSPIIYRDSAQADELRALASDCFALKKALYHYLATAENNNREFLQKEQVKLKKYFYVIRPLLSCRWILERHSTPPMLFSTLVEHCLPAPLKESVDKLLDLKLHNPELKFIPKVGVLNEFIEESLSELKATLATLGKDPATKWAALDGYFIKTVKESAS